MSDQSTILVSTILAELSVNADFAALTESQQLRILESACSQNAQIMKNNGKHEVIVDTIDGGVPQSGVSTQIKSGRFEAMSAGTSHLFSDDGFSPFSGDYVLFTWDDTGQPVQNNGLTKTATEFIVVPAIDNTFVNYLAYPR